MTTPDPNAPQGQPGYGQQPAYGGPAGGAARPPQVLTAAILGFVTALLLLLAAFAYFAFSSIVGFLALFGVLFLALAAGCITGGVLAITGKGGQVLTISAAVAGALVLLGIIIALAGGAGFDTFSLLVLVMCVGIVVLLNQAPAKQYFASKRR
ncbi:hypothetical protein [Blastococcus sp. SYSU D00820]